MATHPVHGLALCAGVGTIELGLRLALGSTYRTVGYVERETFAASVLVARMAETAMDRAPVWDDLATFDGRPWRGKVDIVTAGFPCQPFSQAGKRAGTNDDRWLWPHVHRIISEVQPSYVFLENVAPIVKHGLAEILHGLAANGFDAEWDCLSAVDVGATHIRKRLWLLAYRDRERLASLRFPARQRRHLVDRQGGTDVADTESDNRRTRLPEETTGHHIQPLRIREPRDSECLLADTQRPRPQGTVHCLQERLRRPPDRGDELPLWPPRPTDTDGWRNPALPQPSVRRTSDGLAYRLDRLHAIGNGVVPLVAAVAFIRLAERARLDVTSNEPLVRRTQRETR